MKQNFTIADFLPVTSVSSLKTDLKTRIQLRRKEAQFSREELASRSGVSYGSIRRFESTGEISLSSLLKISHAIGLLDEFDALFKQPIIKNLKDLK
jgi:transcriptional regulator with XRE-family HTH domain